MKTIHNIATVVALAIAVLLLSSGNVFAQGQVSQEEIDRMDAVMKTYMAQQRQLAQQEGRSTSRRSGTYPSQAACEEAVYGGYATEYKPTIKNGAELANRPDVRVIPAERWVCADMQIQGGRGWASFPPGTKFLHRKGANGYVNEVPFALAECGNTIHKILFVDPTHQPRAALAPLPAQPTLADRLAEDQAREAQKHPKERKSCSTGCKAGWFAAGVILAYAVHEINRDSGGSSSSGTDLAPGTCGPTQGCGGSGGGGLGGGSGGGSTGLGGGTSGGNTTGLGGGTSP